MLAHVLMMPGTVNHRVKVIGAGHGRTGTSSLRLALQPSLMDGLFAESPGACITQIGLRLIAPDLTTELIKKQHQRQR